MASVFVSHRTVDSEVAARLAKDLTRSGHQVSVDVFDLRLGHSIVEFMNRGLSNAKYVLLCCSAAGTESPWISQEWMSALARQLSGENIRLVPILLAGSRLPAIIADLKYVDLADYNLGLTAILHDLECDILNDARL